ncbi:MAG: ABC transporter permease, partial [Dongiaceae bacterium]
FARARGISMLAIYFIYALKNTLVPIINILGLQIGTVVAFAVITETVFQWPGVGLLLIQSVNAADVPILAAYLIFVAILFTFINLAVDIASALVDPRIRARPA